MTKAALHEGRPDLQCSAYKRERTLNPMNQNTIAIFPSRTSEPAMNRFQFFRQSLLMTYGVKTPRSQFKSKKHILLENYKHEYGQTYADKNWRSAISK